MSTLEDEEKFLLDQEIQRAAIRIRENRQQPIDLFIFFISCIDSFIEFAYIPRERLSMIEPRTNDSNTMHILTSLNDDQLISLSSQVDFHLEVDRVYSEYWHALKTVLSAAAFIHANSQIQAEIDKILREKSINELQNLRLEVEYKLDSNEPIDVEYWELLLKNIEYFLALNVIDTKIMENYQKFMYKISSVNDKLEKKSMGEKKREEELKTGDEEWEDLEHVSRHDPNRSPVPTNELLKKEVESLRMWEQEEYHKRLKTQRLLVLTNNFTPRSDYTTTETGEKRKHESGVLLFDTTFIDKRGKKHNDPYKKAKLKAILDIADFSNSTKDETLGRIQFDQEEEEVESAVAQEMRRMMDVQENVMESTIHDKPSEDTLGPYELRKPRYHNTVSSGFEWTKYNQVHYDSENPPQRVVQGYKFTIFYPYLLDPTQSPTYKVLKDPEAWNDNTVLLMFSAGAPYEDIAFRIVNKDWEYGFRSGFSCVFEHGILRLWFRFKRDRYRR